MACGALMLPAQTWTLLTTDPSGDSGGLDATALEYRYDEGEDMVWFRITCANLANYSTGPAADFSFQLPNGLDSGDPPGAHWTTPGTPVHKIGYIYADAGGEAPADYTFTSWPVYIEVASTQVPLCNDCISVMADVPANQLVYGIARTDIITDTEMGGSSATVTLVANVGHDVGWDDNVTSGVEFTIDLATSISEAAVTTGATLGPNPATEQLSIFLNGHSPISQATLYDTSGKRVRMFATDGPVGAVWVVDLSGEPAGTYILELRYRDGGMERQRFEHIVR